MLYFYKYIYFALPFINQWLKEFFSQNRQVEETALARWE
jgi:hypothetical protein